MSKYVSRTAEAEQAVVGAMLIDPRCVPVVMQQLREPDFSVPELRSVFGAIRGLFLERAAIDAVIVLDRLGSQSYSPLLSDLMRMTPTAANVEEYTRIVHEGAQLRQIQDLAWQIAQEATTLETARAMLSGAVGLLADRQADRDRSYTELLHDALDRQNDKTPPDWLDWGFPGLREKLMTSPGKFVILGADSSVGKTALSLQFALAFARQGRRVGFYSYETSLADVADRMIANDADVSLGRVKGKKLGAAEVMRIMAAGERSEKLDLRILETARYTVDDIRARTVSRGFDVIFIDYLQLIPNRQRDRYQAVTEISMQLHALAQELHVTIVALSQVTVPELNKKGERRYLTKDDLRDSGQLKMDADAVMLLDLSDPKDMSSNRVLIVDKNKDGELAHLTLSFDPTRMRFAYVPPPVGTDQAKADARNATMDRNAAERKEKEAAKEKTEIDGQGSFVELEDDDGPLPF